MHTSLLIHFSLATLPNLKALQGHIYNRTLTVQQQQGLLWTSLLETSSSCTSCGSWKQSKQQPHSDRVPRMGEEGLFFEVIWYLHQGTTDVYHECWTNASKQCWLQSRVNCLSSTHFTARPTHVINPWTWGVMSASWISLHWLRPKFGLQCHMNGPGFDFLPKK